MDNRSKTRATGQQNKAGRLIPLTSTSAFARVLTELDQDINTSNRDVLALRSTNRHVDLANAAATACASPDS